VLLLVLPASGAAADGGPSPGVLTGWDGVLSPNGAVRYVTLSGRGGWTNVAAVRVRGGRSLNFKGVRGFYGVPLVTQNGAAGGLSRDGRTLILSTWPSTQPGAVSRFAVLDTRRLRVHRIVTLRGSYSYDALSPDAETLYLIQYVPGSTSVRYRVRAFDLVAGRLLPGAIADKRLWGDYMRGSPVSRATTADGGWVYTLYSKPDGTGFVHALDAAHRAAVCVNLPWRRMTTELGYVRLALDGKDLILRQHGLGKLAAIDTQSFAVRAFRKPAVVTQ